MAQVRSTTSLTLELPPSCIEFVPQHPEYFVIGTYNLEKQELEIEQEEKPGGEQNTEIESSPQQRNGSLILCGLESDELQIIRTLPTNFAILDLHFDPHRIQDTHESLLCTANSTGSLAFYRIEFDSGKLPRISENSVFQLWDPIILVLSFAWHPTDPSLLGATLSTGEVVLCRINQKKSDIVSLITIASHTLEAWTLAFELDNSSLLSGGDDAVLQRSLFHSDDVGAEYNEIMTTVWKNRKIHGAGVTAILPLTKSVVITGSYDDHVRIIDIGNRPNCLAETHLGGGVWRLKLIANGSKEHSDTQKTAEYFDILASCMHAGARILRVYLGKTPGITVLAQFEEHKSMNYGSDIQPRTHASGYTIVSTSFYDQLLCLWRFKP